MVAPGGKHRHPAPSRPLPLFSGRQHLRVSLGDSSIYKTVCSSPSKAMCR